MHPSSKVKPGTLYFFCGKMGAGKSTESKALAGRENAVLISEDEWLSTLYPSQIDSFEKYIHYAALLRPLVFAHVTNILRAGANVVMDFPANTPKQRKWFVDLAESAGAQGELVYLRASDELCLARIAIRAREQPERAAFDTESVFRQVSRYFQEPDDSENLSVRVVVRDA